MSSSPEFSATLICPIWRKRLAHVSAFSHLTRLPQRKLRPTKNKFVRKTRLPMNRRQMMLLTGALASSAAVNAYGGPRKQNGSATLFDPAHFGAVGDGNAFDSPAINAAVDACTKAGGGMVYLRPGTYRSGTVVLKSNVTLYLEAGAVLLGSTEMSDYGTQGRIMHVSGHSTKHRIYAEDAENITLAGPGRIAGQSSTFWEPTPPHQGNPGSQWQEVAPHAFQAKPTGRPTPMIQIESCRRVHLEDLRIEG